MRQKTMESNFLVNEVGGLFLIEHWRLFSHSRGSRLKNERIIRCKQIGEEVVDLDRTGILIKPATDRRREERLIPIGDPWAAVKQLPKPTRTRTRHTMNRNNVTDCGH